MSYLSILSLSVFLFSQVSLAEHSREALITRNSQTNQIKLISAEVFNQFRDQLLAQKAKYGKIRWERIQDKFNVISVVGDSASSDVLLEILDRLDPKKFDPKIKNFRLELVTEKADRSILSGVRVKESRFVDRRAVIRLGFRVFDRCASSFKTGSYARDRWTNYVQAAGVVIGTLATRKLRWQFDSCDYDSRARKISQ